MTDTSTSLLRRLLNHHDEAAWARFNQLYAPLIRTWVGRHVPQPPDADDLAQQVFTVVLKKLPEFRHNGQTGAFRAWLRGICVNRVRMFWRTIPPNVPDAEAILQQLEYPDSELSRQWDREHDEFVLVKAWELIKNEFTESTRQIFSRLAEDHAAPATVAAEMGITVNAVYVAKSRVMRRLREELAGML